MGVGGQGGEGRGDVEPGRLVAHVHPHPVAVSARRARRRRPSATASGRRRPGVKSRPSAAAAADHRQQRGDPDAAGDEDDGGAGRGLEVEVVAGAPDAERGAGGARRRARRPSRRGRRPRAARPPGSASGRRGRRTASTGAPAACRRQPGSSRSTCEPGSHGGRSRPFAAASSSRTTSCGHERCGGDDAVPLDVAEHAGHQLSWRSWVRSGAAADGDPGTARCCLTTNSRYGDPSVDDQRCGVPPG